MAWAKGQVAAVFGLVVVVFGFARLDFLQLAL
jgi:hypothetical protein